MEYVEIEFILFSFILTLEITVINADVLCLDEIPRLVTVVYI